MLPEPHICRQKLRACRMVTTWLRLDWIGRWLWLENRFTPSASFLSFRVSFVTSLSLETKRSHAEMVQAERRSLCRHACEVKIPSGTTYSASAIGSHCARYIFSKNNKLCGICPLYIYLYTVYLLWSMIQHYIVQVYVSNWCHLLRLVM